MPDTSLLKLPQAMRLGTGKQQDLLLNPRLPAQ